MIDFSYSRSHSLDDAVEKISGHKRARFVGGGTNLLDLMRADVMHPRHLIDINHLGLKEIEALPNGGVRIGALVTNTELAYHPVIETQYPLLSQAILSGASPQLRNMATVGGNLMQRTRCAYFYDTATPCNKRRPNSGCSAREGDNRMHAILGTSEACIAVHPSDMCVALTALDATVQVTGQYGNRSIPIAEFHRLPGDTPELDTNLGPDEIITAIDLPKEGYPRHYSYLKIRDRSSYAFALVAVAVNLEIEDDWIRSARVALGGVAHKPWRDREAEEVLKDSLWRDAEVDFQRFGRLLLRNAKGFGKNDFKIPLAHKAIVRTLQQAVLREFAV